MYIVYPLRKRNCVIFGSFWAPDQWPALPSAGTLWRWLCQCWLCCPTLSFPYREKPYAPGFLPAWTLVLKEAGSHHTLVVSFHPCGTLLFWFKRSSFLAARSCAVCASLSAPLINCWVQLRRLLSPFLQKCIRWKRNTHGSFVIVSQKVKADGPLRFLDPTDHFPRTDSVCRFVELCWQLAFKTFIGNPAASRITGHQSRKSFNFWVWVLARVRLFSKDGFKVRDMERKRKDFISPEFRVSCLSPMRQIAWPGNFGAWRRDNARGW